MNSSSGHYQNGKNGKYYFLHDPYFFCETLLKRNCYSQIKISVLTFAAITIKIFEIICSQTVLLLSTPVVSLTSAFGNTTQQISTSLLFSRGASFKQEAEITPVEPEQGNACEGKVTRLQCSSPLAIFPVPKNLLNEKN